MNTQSPTHKILNIVQNLEREIQRENRGDRMKATERNVELLQGRIERVEDQLKALSQYLEVEYVREAKYVKR